MKLSALADILSEPKKSSTKERAKNVISNTQGMLRGWERFNDGWKPFEMECFISCKYLVSNVLYSKQGFREQNWKLNNGIHGMQKYETTFKQNLKIKLFLIRKYITMSVVPVYPSYPLCLKKGFSHKTANIRYRKILNRWWHRCAYFGRYYS